MTSWLLKRLVNNHKASGQLALFPEQVRGHDSQSQSDPLLSLAPFVAILKKPLFMNYQWIGFQLQKTGKDTGKKGREEGGTGGEDRGGEWIHKASLLSVIEIEVGTKPAAIGKGGRGQK